MSTQPSSNRLVSLAAGVVQEFPPEQVVYAAANAGFNSVGLWCDLASWTDERTRAVQTAIADTGIVPLDIEVVWFRPGEPITHHDRFVEIAATLNVRNILCVSSEPDITDTEKKFAHLCRLTEGGDIRIMLEFLAITEINTLTKALEVVRNVAHPAGGILIDALHLQRTGSGVQDVIDIETDFMPYMQICDASLELSDTSPAGVLEDAVYLRSIPGVGELPLKELLEAVDANLPLSLEIRSRELNEQYPDLQDRANAVYVGTYQFLNSLHEVKS